MMAISILFFFFFSLILFNLLEASTAKDSCSTPSCNSLELFSVKFPFRLPEYQTNTRCGYSSNFTLACSPSKQTLLHLPNASSFAIYTIDYVLQKVTVTDPDKCLPGRFLNLDLSSSPFSFSSSQKYTYYNCTGISAGEYLYSYRVSCMSDRYHSVIVLLSGTENSYEIRKKACTVIKSFVSGPSQLYSYPDLFRYLDLYWFVPRCGQCARTGLACGFLGVGHITGCLYTTGETGLSPPAKANSGMSWEAKSVLAIVIGFPGLMMMLAVGAYMCNRSERSEERPLNVPQTNELIRTQPGASHVTIDPSAPAIIESHPVFVLGEGDVLLEPNISPCAICLCEYKAGEMLRTILDCNHYFHSDCLDGWLKIKATCPVCRKGA